MLFLLLFWHVFLHRDSAKNDEKIQPLHLGLKYGGLPGPNGPTVVPPGYNKSGDDRNPTLKMMKMERELESAWDFCPRLWHFLL